MKISTIEIIIADCGTIVIPEDLSTAVKPSFEAMVYSDK